MFQHIPGDVVFTGRPDRCHVNELRRDKDPTGAARKMEKRWIVENKLEIGKQEDTRLRKCTHIVFQRGDFVDATVTADIATLAAANGRRTQVHFKLQRVVRLLPRAHIMVSRPHYHPSITHQHASHSHRQDP